MFLVGVDSYVTVMEADEYVAQFYTTTDPQYLAWNNLDRTSREIYLRKSTRELDSLSFAGRKVDPKQQLAFPRLFTASRPGVKYSTEVPLDIKRAQIENALSLANPEDVEEASFYQRLRSYGVVSYSVGHLRETLVQWNGGSNDASERSVTGKLTSVIATVLVQPYLVKGADIR